MNEEHKFEAADRVTRWAAMADYDKLKERAEKAEKELALLQQVLGGEQRTGVENHKRLWEARVRETKEWQGEVERLYALVDEYRKRAQEAERELKAQSDERELWKERAVAAEKERPFAQFDRFVKLVNPELLKRAEKAEALLVTTEEQLGRQCVDLEARVRELLRRAEQAEADLKVQTERSEEDLRAVKNIGYLNQAWIDRAEKAEAEVAGLTEKVRTYRNFGAEKVEGLLRQLQQLQSEYGEQAKELTTAKAECFDMHQRLQKAETEKRTYSVDLGAQYKKRVEQLESDLKVQSEVSEADLRRAENSEKREKALAGRYERLGKEYEATQLELNQRVEELAALKDRAEGSDKPGFTESLWKGMHASAEVELTKCRERYEQRVQELERVEERAERVEAAYEKLKLEYALVEDRCRAQAVELSRQPPDQVSDRVRAAVTSARALALRDAIAALRGHAVTKMGFLEREAIGTEAVRVLEILQKHTANVDSPGEKT